MEIKVQDDGKILRILMHSDGNGLRDRKNLFNIEIKPDSHKWGKMTDVMKINPLHLNKIFTLDDLMEIIEQSFKSTL